jgi:hypothetical protein
MIRRSVSANDFWFFTIATILLYVCQLLVWLVPFRWYIFLFRDSRNSHRSVPEKDRIHIVRKALARGVHYLPWRAKCLVQALAGKFLLRIMHMPGTIFLGVAKGEEGLKAHAWLVSGDHFISGKQGYKKFTVVKTIS